MSKAEKIRRCTQNEYIEARLGYVATLVDQGHSNEVIRQELTVGREVYDLRKQITRRDRDAAEEDFIFHHAIHLYNAYRQNCQRPEGIAKWCEVKEYVKDRWIEIARQSYEVIKAKLGGAPGFCPMEARGV